jgi:hypothetical protein
VKCRSWPSAHVKISNRVTLVVFVSHELNPLGLTSFTTKLMEALLRIVLKSSPSAHAATEIQKNAYMYIVQSLETLRLIDSQVVVIFWNSYCLLDSMSRAKRANAGIRLTGCPETFVFWISLYFRNVDTLDKLIFR